VLEKHVRSESLRRSFDPHFAPRGPTSHATVEQQPEHPVMRLWAMDAWVRHRAILTDRERLQEVLYDAAEVAGLTVMGEEFCVFDNHAVTGVLVLAQSHLSIHTWPEFGLANVDLLSYGNLPAEEVMSVIGRLLVAEHVTLACVVRAVK
jgi:S-adenosylmethionine decarboxylase